MYSAVVTLALSLNNKLDVMLTLLRCCAFFLTLLMIMVS